MTDRRTIRELRAHANKVAGYGHLVAHEMVDEIEELRRENNNLWRGVAEYRLEMMRSLRASKDAGWAIAKARGRELATAQTGYLQARREHDELTALHRAEISHFPPKKENT